MSLAAQPDRPTQGSAAVAQWAEFEAVAPLLVRTMRRYLDQIATFLAPTSVAVAETSLRQLVEWLLANTDIEAVAEIRRDDIEDFKVWLAARLVPGGARLSSNTHRHRLRQLRAFFERIIEWDWPDSPARNPIIGGDIPKKPEPLPKFLDDRDAAKLMAAARAATDPRDRLVVEILARTGMRAGELANLEADAMVAIGDGHWLRIPLGKLRNDRYVPLHPDLVALLAGWTAENLSFIRRHHRMIADHRGTLDRHLIGRIVKRVGRSCDVKVHPHQLRHTLATQAKLGAVALDASLGMVEHRFVVGNWALGTAA